MGFLREFWLALHLVGHAKRLRFRGEEHGYWRIDFEEWTFLLRSRSLYDTLRQTALD